MTAVVVQLVPEDDRPAYANVARLMPNVPAPITRDALVAALGDPDDLDGDDLFAFAGGSALVEHANGLVRRIALLP